MSQTKPIARAGGPQDDFRRIAKSAAALGISQHIQSCDYCLPRLLEILKQCPEASRAIKIIRENKGQIDDLVTSVKKLLGGIGRLVLT